jgi:hypothetical protein
MPNYIFNPPLGETISAPNECLSLVNQPRLDWSRYFATLFSMEKDLATYSVHCAEVIDNAPVLVDDSDDVDIPVGRKRGRAPMSEAVDDADASPSSTI